MDLSLTPEEEQLVAVVSSLMKQESSPERVRAAEASGFDPALWHHLLSLGLPAIAAADDNSPPASLFQLSLVSERAGSALASAPIIESLVAARLLDRFQPMTGELLDAVREGRMVGTVSLSTAPADAPRLVPAGAIAQIILALDGDDLVAVVGDPPGGRADNLGCLPLAYRKLVPGERIRLASGPEAAAAFNGACRDWKVLSAAQLVGLSSAALDLGVDYAKSREVFGAAIATFQTIAHRLADDATAIDGARLLAYKAAWAADEGRSGAGALASMAWSFSSETALGVTRDSLHYHGGYGFTREYDIQLYFRRAKAYPLVWGDPRAEYQRLADELFGEGGTST